MAVCHSEQSEESNSGQILRSAQNDKLLVFSVSGALWADVFVVHLYSMSGTVENVERTIQLPLFLEVL